MGAPASVIELVARFQRNRETYRSAAYNETQVRREFIDPFGVWQARQATQTPVRKGCPVINAEKQLGGQIEQLVYELYGLTNEEIALVEGVGERAAVVAPAHEQEAD